jgi:hypothetical protein
MVPVVEQPAVPGLALGWATLFARPSAGSAELGVVPEGERVQVLGRASGVWERWLYVRYAETEGFVWEGLLQVIEALQLTDVQPGWECREGVKLGGFRIGLAGGDGNYTFSWEGQIVEGIELDEPERYYVFWPWESAPRTGVLTIASGDGQTVTSPTQYMGEPKCP